MSSRALQLIAGRYLAAPPALADGQIAPLLYAADGSILISGSVSTGGLTDAELRASPVPISVSAQPISVTGSTVAVSASALPVGAATEATLALVRAKTDNLDVLLSTRATEATLATRATEATLVTRATEATLATRATEATLATRATEATLALIKAKTDNLDVALSTRQINNALVTARSLNTNFGTDVQMTPKASPGRVLSFSCRNLAGASRFLQLHNSAVAVVALAVPLLTFLVPGMSTIVVGTDFFGESGDFVQGGIEFSTGITWAYSTTGPFFTAAAAADQFTQLTYR